MSRSVPSLPSTFMCTVSSGVLRCERDELDLLLFDVVDMVSRSKSYKSMKEDNPWTSQQQSSGKVWCCCSPIKVAATNFELVAVRSCRRCQTKFIGAARILFQNIRADSFESTRFRRAPPTSILSSRQCQVHTYQTTRKYMRKNTQFRANAQKQLISFHTLILTVYPLVFRFFFWSP